MNIFRKKDAILAALGNMRAMEKVHVDTHTEEKIKNISGNKIAESKQGQFWVSFQELNGFLFLNATIITAIDLKTTNGTKITLLTNEYEIEIESDEKEIESNFSNVSNRYITEVSFIIESKEKDIIENKNFEEIEYQLKKGNLRFKMK